MSNPFSDAAMSVLRLMVQARQASEHQGKANAVPNLTDSVRDALALLLDRGARYRSASAKCEAELASFVDVADHDRPTWGLELAASMLRQAQRELDDARDAFELAAVRASSPEKQLDFVGFYPRENSQPAIPGQLAPAAVAQSAAVGVGK